MLFINLPERASCAGLVTTEALTALEDRKQAQLAPLVENTLLQ